MNDPGWNCDRSLSRTGREDKGRIGRHGTDRPAGHESLAECGKIHYRARCLSGFGIFEPWKISKQTILPNHSFTRPEQYPTEPSTKTTLFDVYTAISQLFPFPDAFSCLPLIAQGISPPESTALIIEEPSARVKTGGTSKKGRRPKPKPGPARPAMNGQLTRKFRSAYIVLIIGRERMSHVFYSWAYTGGRGERTLLVVSISRERAFDSEGKGAFRHTLCSGS